MLPIEYKTWPNFEAAGDEGSPVFMPMYPDETVRLQNDVTFRLFMWTVFDERGAVEDWISQFGPYDEHPSSCAHWEAKQKEMQKAWYRSRKSRQTEKDRILYQAAIDDHLQNCRVTMRDDGSLVVKCDYLLTAMWMQMAFAISGDVVPVVPELSKAIE